MPKSTQRAISPYPARTDLPTTGDGTKSRTRHDSPAMPAERDPVENISHTLEQMFDVLRASTIAEELGTDLESKFWATYKRVSNDYDDDFLERADDDMAIILIFAGLFSTVNSTFIMGMQPSPVETTNILMVQLIKVIAEGSNAIDIANLSSSTTYPSSNVWMQALAYASLSFSLLAAFGAVVGKQWLNSYKSARGRGSLEERGMQRQMKLDGLGNWHLETILKTFLVLLQISLLLFGLSLSANMWNTQRTISSIILSTTTVGAVFYGFTMVVSVLRPNSPFQMVGSASLKTIFKRFLPDSPPSPDSDAHTFAKASAIRWILETSTNPEDVEVAAAMVPLVRWKGLHTEAMYKRLRETFRTYRDKQELFTKCGKAMAHLCIQSAEKNRGPFWDLRHDPDAFGGKSRLIRDAFMTGYDAWNRLKVEKHPRKQQELKDNTLTALKTMVVYGHRSTMLSATDSDDDVIWIADLQWRRNGGHTPRCEEFDWLVDHLVEYVEKWVDNERQSDALLALGAMHSLGSSAQRPSYVKALIHCMGPTRPPKVRNAALRAAFEARREVASIANDPVQHGIDAKLLDELSCALADAVRPDRNVHQDTCYLRIIFSLAQNDEWHQRLARDGHIELCISLVEEPARWSSADPNLEWAPHLVGIFVRISGNLPSRFPQERWRKLIIFAWTNVSIDCRTRYTFEALPALVTATRQKFLGPSNDVRSEELEGLTRALQEVVREFCRVQQDESLAVTPHYFVLSGIMASDVLEQATLANGQAHELFETVFRDVHGLYDDLSRMLENWNPSPDDEKFVD